MPLWLQGLLLRYDWLYRTVYRYRCPYPVRGITSARGCYRAGVCGCDNARRFAPKAGDRV